MCSKLIGKLHAIGKTSMRLFLEDQIIELLKDI